MPVLLTMAPVIKYKGTTPLKADDVIDLRVESTIGLASRATVRLRWDLTSPAPKIGDPLEVSFTGASNSVTVVFKGEVVSMGGDIDASGAELTITAYDKAHRLSKATRTRTFKKQSYGDIIGTMAGETGLSAQADSSLSNPKHDYLVQTTTNHAFLTEICMRTGCEWLVDDTKLIVRPRATAAGLTLTLGDDLLRVNVRYSAAEHATKVKVMGWDVAKKQAIVSEQTSTVTAKSSSGPGPVFTGASADQSPFGAAILQTSTVPVVSQAEADIVAKGLGVRLSTTKMIVKGEAILVPTLKVGTEVTLKNVGQHLSGKYYLTAVEHVFGANRSATTRFTAGGLEPSSLVDLLGSADHGAAPWGQLGVVIGIVTNNDQAAGDNKPGPGKVMVKFPTLSDAVESAPARLVAPEAGKGKGTYYVPEINDEVLVAFEHGDLRLPYVLGSLWNAKDTPPTVADIVKNGKVMARQTRTRLGHTMTFNDGDADDKKNLTILLADNKTTLVLGHDKIDLVANDGKPIKITNGSGKATITLKDNGDIELKGQNIIIDAQKKITMKSMQDTEITPSTNFKVNASVGVELKGNAPCKFESSAILTLKGAMVKIN